MAYVKRHPIKSTLNKSLDYIVNSKKTDEKILISANKCAINSKLTYRIMQSTKENYKKTGGVLGIHFTQSFKPGEIKDYKVAHEIGQKWADKFLKEYEYILATHVDKNHVHNHIIINSVSYETGKKYLKNDGELRRIRKLSDEVLREYGLSIIEPKKENRNRSHKEWQSVRENISWKDRIKIDINKTIEESKDYKEFIEKMKARGYELKYGNVKYNSFKHEDMGRATRGKTIGEDYTEDAIKRRIEEYHKDKKGYLEKYNDKKELKFDDEKHFTKSYSNKEIIKADIDLSIYESKDYEDFIRRMKEKGYELRYGDVKYNSFKHRDMGRATRGRTIGNDYTENRIIKRINNYNYAKDTISEDNTVAIKPNYRIKRYSNNKYKYSQSIQYKYRTNTVQNYKFNQNKVNFRDDKIKKLLFKYSIGNIEEIIEKLDTINLGLDNKKEEHNYRVELIKDYNKIFNLYQEDKNNGLGLAKDINEFKDKLLEQKEMLNKNNEEYSRYKEIKEELSYLEYIYRDNLKEIQKNKSKDLER